jgi:pentatricopeptide repeat protein
MLWEEGEVARHRQLLQSRRHADYRRQSPGCEDEAAAPDGQLSGAGAGELVQQPGRRVESKDRLGLAWIYYRNSDTEKAIEEFNIVLSLDPKRGDGLNGLGMTYMKRKEYSKALPYFERGVIAQPDNPNMLESLANGYFRNGRVAEAKTTLQKMHERFPDMYFFDFLRYIHALEEDYGDTLRILDSVLEVCTPGEKTTAYIEKGFYRGWIGDLSGSWVTFSAPRSRPKPRRTRDRKLEHYGSARGSISTSINLI